MPEPPALQSARRLACLRGLRFIHQHSLVPENFEDWSGDYLWCFYCISSTSSDAELSRLAAEFGAQAAHRWMASESLLPPLADAGEVAYYVSQLHVCGLFGIGNPSLRRHVEQAIPRFDARAYLAFDPLREPPPALPDRSRYDVFCDALVLTYTGEGFGVPLGANYADVLRWLPELRPYPDAAEANPEFRDIVFAITHLIYTLNDYSRYRLSPEWLPDEFDFLRSNLKVPLVAGDPELLGEFVDSLRAFGIAETDPTLAGSAGYLLSSQHPDGSWGDLEAEPHTRYHTAWTAIDALRDYAWRDRADWPESIRRSFRNYR